MRERSYRIDTSKLEALNQLYTGNRIARELNMSRQRWSMYKTGKNDMPESVLDRLCENYDLKKDDLALA